MVGAFEEPYHEYWYDLGRFIHAFARAEAALLFLLRDVSGLSKRRAGVLFNGVRSDEARVTINGFLDATKQPEKKNRLKRPFAQIAAIGTIRNNIVHWGATTDLGLYFTVSNIDRSPLRPLEYTVSIPDFKNMCEDLALIASLLDCEISGSGWTEKLRDGISRIPWRYKPPQPSPRARTKGRGRPKGPPPPRTSRK